MQLSFSSLLDDDRDTTAIGRLRVATRWRAADDCGDEAERGAAVEALMREAAEYGADAVVDVRFETDDVKGVDIEGVVLRRIVVTGLAVRFKQAA
jgi:uncharacterized protein YbjQ (UPF0145 family)